MRIPFLRWFHRKIGRAKAMEIVAKHVGVGVDELWSCHDGLPEHCHPYFPREINESFWCVFAPWMDGKDGTMLRSSRIVLVAKKGGMILADESANDEG